MGELETILAAIALASGEDRGVALATVVAIAGSGYRQPGARMLVTADGATTGTVSGGCLEQERQRRVMPAHLRRGAL